jgi:hypothetical protein
MSVVVLTISTMQIQINTALSSGSRAASQGIVMANLGRLWPVRTDLGIWQNRTTLICSCFGDPCPFSMYKENNIIIGYVLHSAMILARAVH